MGQVTRETCRCIIEAFERKDADGGFPLTSWEKAQFAHAWLAREDAVQAERERCAQIAESRDVKMLAFLIRGVPERTTPRNSDGAWFWSERDEHGEWQHYRANGRPAWAV